MIQLQGKGYKPITRIVEIEAGKQRVEKIDPEQSAEAKGIGTLRVIMANPVEGAEYFLKGGWSLLASGIGILFLLMFLPGGLGEVLYRARDYWLRFLAGHYKVVVPSLVADVRVVSEEPPAHIGTALEGLTDADALPVATGMGTASVIDRHEGDDGDGEGPRPRRRRTGTAPRPGGGT